MPIRTADVWSLEYPVNKPVAQATEQDLEVLQVALVRLKLLASVGATVGDTVAAVIAFQVKIDPFWGSGVPNQWTLAAINEELSYRYFADNKTRVSRLHGLLQQLGYSIDAKEAEERRYGQTTTNAVAAFQSQQNQNANGRITPTLHNAIEDVAVKAQYQSGAGLTELHKMLLRMLPIAKLPLPPEVRNFIQNEMNQNEFGHWTKEVVRAFQSQKCGIPNAPGVLDGKTVERLQSFVVSRPARIRKLKAPAAVNLSSLPAMALRINASGEAVATLQQALAYLGFEIALEEHATQTFGQTTREAVVAYQKQQNLFPDGLVVEQTLTALNGEIDKANPQAAAQRPTHRVRGKVRNDLWEGVADALVQVVEVTGRGQTIAVLAERPTDESGFYCVQYHAPRISAKGEVKSPLYIEVRVTGADTQVLGKKKILNPARSEWANFTGGRLPYRGFSEIERLLRKLDPDAGAKGNSGVPVVPRLKRELEEEPGEKTLVRLSRETGVSVEVMVRLDLARRLADKANNPLLTEDVFYLYLAQNQPSGIPIDLLQCTDGWTATSDLVDIVLRGIVSMDPADHARCFKRAVKKHSIPIATIRKRDEILGALKAKRLELSFDVPVKSDGGTFGQMLDLAGIVGSQRVGVAEAFLAHDGVNRAFWADKRVVDLGTSLHNTLQEAADLVTIIEHPGLSTYVKNTMGTQGFAIQKVSDCAKLDLAGWKNVIAQSPVVFSNPEIVAQRLMAESQLRFPSIALVAEVGRGTAHGLSHLSDVMAFLDASPGLDLAGAIVPVFANSTTVKNLLASMFDATVIDNVLEELKIIQRVQGMSPNVSVGRALIELGFTNSASVVMAGETQFIQQLMKRGIPADVAAEAFNQAEFRYAQIVDLLLKYNAGFHLDSKALIGRTYKRSELSGTNRTIPDLDVLFGSEDLSDCHEHNSLWGAPAYLADILRFLGTLPAEGSGTVLDVLFERRPDIKRIKLSRENTETPLPYADLVCEVLEGAVLPGNERDFAFQTTLNPEELRASPENTRFEAYNILRSSDYPMDISFDLWQEETRLWLKHLGVPRWQWMELLSDGTKDEMMASIAGEYFGISSYETALICSPRPVAPEQKLIWEFDESPEVSSSIYVKDFLERSKLEYRELLELEQVKWVWGTLVPINGKGGELSEQMLVEVTVERLDRMHRFLRLWRKTGWAMWELDLMLRAPAVGGGKLDKAALASLHRFHCVQERFGLTCEETLALFEGNEINKEVRAEPDDPHKAFVPLYSRLFAHRGVARLDSPLLSENRPALRAALAMSDVDLSAMLSRLDEDKVSAANLRRLFGWACTARALSLRVEELFQLSDLAGIDDCLFTSPQSLLDFVGLLDRVRESGVAIAELEYILRYVPESPLGLRDAVIARMVEELREFLLTLSDNWAHEDLEDEDVEGDEADEEAGGEEDGKVEDGRFIEKLSSLCGIDRERLAVLLEVVVEGELTLKEVLTDPGLLTTGALGESIDISRESFPSLFSAIEWLHKVRFVLSTLPALSMDDFVWMTNSSDSFRVLQLTELPSASKPTELCLERWIGLAGWRNLVKQFPEPEGTSWRDVIEQTAECVPSGVPEQVGQFWSMFVKLAKWVEDDGLALAQLAGDLGLDKLPPVEACLTLVKIMHAARRLGVKATAARSWIDRDSSEQAAIANEVHDSSKSKYDERTWLQKAGAIQDVLRERKRTALCRYLIEWSLRKNLSPTITIKDREFACPTGPNPLLWRDELSLIRYFLLDVEMGADQLTSRIKQAISSVQMFVQRCLLNLEQPRVQTVPKQTVDRGLNNPWEQWQAMKSFRVWQAARKILLYPENWIEPELRANKSPFFAELEADLAKDEMTEEHAEDCFRCYLEKVHEVSHLTVLGVYRETSTDGDSDLFHVVARTKAEPAVYYYRFFDAVEKTWSAWEKIEVDITGEHVHPFVYDRKLYLFWLVFLEKPQKTLKQPPAKTSSEPTDSAEPPKVLEIQLAWTQRKGEGWGPKCISRQKLIHPWERPLSSYQLRPRERSSSAGKELLLDVFVSSSREFNDGKFYNPFLDDRNYHARRKFKETDEPWCSSSFVFDGAVRTVMMRGDIGGDYHIHDDRHAFPAGYYGFAGSGEVRTESGKSVARGEVKYTDSLSYIKSAFGEEGRAIEKYSGTPFDITLPVDMHYQFNRLASNEGRSTLNIVGARSLVACPYEARPLEAVATPDWERIIYQDKLRSFFVTSNESEPGYTFYPFYHPYTKLFLRELGRAGVPGLFQRKLQTTPIVFGGQGCFSFTEYSPVSPNAADSSAAYDRVDFSRYGAYALYNWEVFFHAPFLIACRLSQNQRFEEAMRWFHTIFDPTNAEQGMREVPKRYWITKPFYEQSGDYYRRQRIRELLENLGKDCDLAEIQAWRNDPFNPHRIAEHRPVAYQRAVVMRYIDNLIAWGDQLFRRDTIESINEATTLYLLAYEILGTRPPRVPDYGRAEQSYAQLAAGAGLDALGNKSVPTIVESFVNGRASRWSRQLASARSIKQRAVLNAMDLRWKRKKKGLNRDDGLGGAGRKRGFAKRRSGADPMPVLNLYFRIPPNDQLLGRWDLVEDRLFKIRHSMNIDGVFRQLPLFEPPIDPALLVKAAAAGVDIASVISQTSVHPGQYRFRVVLAKAIEYCGEVRGLGEKLLSILEKRDAEELSILRASQETRVLQASRDVRKLQIREAKEAIAGLEKSKQQAEVRREYYKGREHINSWELAALTMSKISATGEGLLAIGHILASGLGLIPAFVVGGAGISSPVATASATDGSKLSDSMEAQLRSVRAGLAALDKAASIAGTVGSYQRRQDDWDHQAKLAEIDIAAIDRQIAGAELRLAIAERELQNLDLQIDNSKTVEEYYKSKYTSKQLYDWMLQQVSTVYFGAYKLAYEMAMRAQKCMQYELGDGSLSFIQFGYWDSLKKGLLAGEKLGYDLRRLESAYFDLHKREFELTKHISMAEVMPLKLLTLKATGGCEFCLEEWLFDMDFPGHYRRRIKSVSLTIPCVSGPYTGVHATLTLTGEGVRLKDASDDDDGALDCGAPPTTPTTSIATSEAQNDAGVFELNFNDERYLPFEGAGAVSKWTLSLPETNQFDLKSISDVIMHVRYTSVPGSKQQVEAAEKRITKRTPSAFAVLLNLAKEYPTEWQQFLEQTPGAQNERVLKFPFKVEQLPFYARNRSPTVASWHLVIESPGTGVDVEVRPPNGAVSVARTADVETKACKDCGALLCLSGTPEAPYGAVGEWELLFQPCAGSGSLLLVSGVCLVVQLSLAD